MFVENAAALSSIVDEGRTGHRRFGVGVCGPMDRVAAHIANLLVGNAAKAALIETTGRLTLHARATTRIAVTGAPAALAGGGRARRPYLPFTLQAGESLVIETPQLGVWMYVAVAGGIDVPVVLGSRTTDLRSGFGGLDGRMLRAGDELPLGQWTPRNGQVGDVWDDLRERRIGMQVGGSVGNVIRAVPLVDKGSRWTSAFWQAAYRISPHSDRMGYRLNGDAMRIDATPGLSEPVLPGTIQLPPDGQPIVLMADAQTTGGYPKIAQVAAVDIGKLAQLRPGENVVFQPITWVNATQLLDEQRRELVRLEWAMSRRFKRGDG